MGHDVIRLPPYHCQYKTTELIRAQIKKEVVEKNTTFKRADVKLLPDKSIDNVTVEDWRSASSNPKNYRGRDSATGADKSSGGSSSEDEDGSQTEDEGEDDRKCLKPAKLVVTPGAVL